MGEVSIGDEQFFAFNLGHTHLYGIYKGIEIEVFSIIYSQILLLRHNVSLLILGSYNKVVFLLIFLLSTL